MLWASTNAPSPRATHAAPLGRAAWLLASLIALLVLPLAACGNGGPSDLSVGPGGPDTTTPPVVPPDTTGPVPPDSGPPVPPPPPPPPPGPLVHEGIPFGPAHTPTDLFAIWSGTVYTATSPDTLLAVLAEARRTSIRLYVNFVGNESNLRDANGFNFDKWKARVDRFTHLDLTPYIDDGTISAHFIMDEPQDATQWNGHPVTPAQIEQMAAYSKQVWPTMVTMIRSTLPYLKGSQYPHLDAIRIQYLERFGPIDAWIAGSVQDAKSLHLAMVGGLNALNGGSKNSGIPGKSEGKFAMNADELRTFGRTFLAEPYICGFLMYQWEPGYFNRTDIRAAMSDLSDVARQLPNRVCRP